MFGLLVIILTLTSSEGYCFIMNNYKIINFAPIAGGSDFFVWICGGHVTAVAFLVDFNTGMWYTLQDFSVLGS